MLRHTAALALALTIANALNVSAAGQVATPNATTPLVVSGSALALAENGLEPAVTLASLARTPKRPTLLPALVAHNQRNARR